jgi:cell cycle checkpoint protein
MELGGVLRARDLLGSAALSPPGSHRLFSKLAYMFGKSFGNMDMLNEGDLDGRADRSCEEEGWAPRKNQEQDGGWLAGDDIEEF